MILGAVLLVTAFGVSATRSAMANMGPGDLQPIRHSGSSRRTFAGQDDEDMGMFFVVPLIAMLRRRQNLVEADSFQCEADRRRDELGIILDVLNLATVPISKKAIRNGARLNFGQTNRYVSFLLDKGMLEVTTANGNRRLTATEKGRELVLLFR